MTVLIYLFTVDNNTFSVYITADIFNNYLRFRLIRFLCFPSYHLGQGNISDRFLMYLLYWTSTYRDTSQISFGKAQKYGICI